LGTKTEAFSDSSQLARHDFPKIFPHLTLLAAKTENFATEEGENRLQTEDLLGEMKSPMQAHAG